MRLMKQLKRVTAARFRAAMETGNFKESAAQIARETDAHLAMAAGAEAKALASSLTWQRRLDEIRGKIARLARGAELAVRQNDEDTAREALVEQLKAEHEAEQLQKTLQQSVRALEDARGTRKEIEEQVRAIREQMTQWRQKAESLTHQGGAAKRHTTIQSKAAEVMSDAFRMEQCLEEAEAEIEIRRRYEDRGDMPLDIRLRELERQAEIDRRLKELGRGRSE